jgi:glycosyltransferase involved in cell wall biosynthesis
MRHGAMTFAENCAQRLAKGESWDLLFCSDMLDLAQFRGLAPAAIQALPTVVYFHENQLTYPVRAEKERDLHFALTNLSTAFAADQIWFNSAYHRDSFFAALPRMLKRMPDYQPYEAVRTLAAKAGIHYPAIATPPTRSARRAGPLRILWAARWEHDKNPQTFFAALHRLVRQDIPFEVSVLGESFRQVPSIFAEAKQWLGPRIGQWGFLDSHSDYLAALGQADVFVSTADHEFFGLSVVEAMAAGAYPLLPDRLSYPELLGTLPNNERAAFLYGGSDRELAQRLRELSASLRDGDLWQGRENLASMAIERFSWTQQRPRLDAALDSLRRCS